MSADVIEFPRSKWTPRALVREDAPKRTLQENLRIILAIRNDDPSLELIAPDYAALVQDLPDGDPGPGAA